MDLFDIAVARKLSSGGGGGGSSDFSTATVTFICTENYYTISGGYFIQNGNAIIPAALTAITVTSNNNVELEIPLYNGQVTLPLLCFFDTDTSVSPTVTGDITLNIESLGFDITGDGSISFKGQGRT